MFNGFVLNIIVRHTVKGFNLMVIEQIAAKRSKTHQRYYDKAGTMLPGVTTILGVLNKPALVPWANKLRARRH